MDIIFYGPFGNNIPEARIGGAEEGCRRSVELITKAGYSVEILEKPTMYYGFRKFICGYAAALRKMNRLLKTNPNAVAYIVGFYDRQIVFEAIMCALAALRKHKVIYEPKNGALIDKYQNNGKLYKKMSKYIFNHADVIFCQGKEYQRFLEQLGYDHGIYHPNYVMKKHTELIDDHRNRIVSFGYVGRVTESKNIEFLIEIFGDFHCRYPDSRLYIIGGYEPEYRVRLDNLTERMNIKDFVTFTGRISFDEISSYLNRIYFFLFPSKEEFEGHSNSLTEAMAFGAVPLASDRGFNKSVIGAKELILKSYDVKMYSDLALDILLKKRWKYYSSLVQRRAIQNYSEDTVKEQYIKTLEEVLRHAHG